MAADDTMSSMGLDDYKVVLFRNYPEGWVAEIPAIAGCHALMLTREEALTELAAVFQLIFEEYRDRNESLPADGNRRKEIPTTTMKLEELVALCDRQAPLSDEDSRWLNDSTRGLEAI